MLLLLLGTACNDQFRSNLGTRPQRADPDIPARQFFRDHAHRCFRQAKAAIFLWDGQTKDAKLGQFLDDVHWDEFILEMPVMGERLDLFDGIAAELFADHLQLIIKARGPDRIFSRAFLHQLNQTAAYRLGICLLRQLHHFGCHQDILVLLAQPQILQAQHFPLADRNATIKLPEIFPKSDLVEQLFHLAEFTLRLKPLGPSLHLAQGFNISCNPSQAMRGDLMFFNQGARDFSIDANHAPHGIRGKGQKRLGRRNRGTGKRQKIRQDCSAIGH